MHGNAAATPGLYAREMDCCGCTLLAPCVACSRRTFFERANTKPQATTNPENLSFILPRPLQHRMTNQHDSSPMFVVVFALQEEDPLSMKDVLEHAGIWGTAESRISYPRSIICISRSGRSELHKLCLCQTPALPRCSPTRHGSRRSR